METIIINLIDKFGYFAIMFLIAIENIFPPIPSEVILTFGGFMTTYTRMNIIFVILFSTVGSVVGALVLYYVGRILSKERLIKIVNGKIGKILHFKESDIEYADKWFRKYSIATVFFCRFIPIVRSLISIPAGMNKMNLSIFLIFTTIGSLIWNTVLCVLGRFAGDSWPQIVKIFSSYSKVGLITLTLIFIAGLIIFYLKKRTKRS